MMLYKTINKGAIIYSLDYRLIVTDKLIHAYHDEGRIINPIGALPKLKPSPMDLSVNQILNHLDHWLRRN